MFNSKPSNAISPVYIIGSAIGFFALMHIFSISGMVTIASMVAIAMIWPKPVIAGIEFLSPRANVSALSAIEAIHAVIPPSLIWNVITSLPQNVIGLFRYKSN